jgi:LAO/AO transport system kinase
LTELVTRIFEGNEMSAARLITMIEEESVAGYAALAELFPRVGRAHVIGVTGSPGTGKSALINKIAVNLTARGKKVGIIAVDPTSMRGSGAFLGDRMRMAEADRLEGIFIRSMAHRGYPGGISRATPGAVYVVEALGKDVIIVESVGVGQTDMGVTTVSDTTLSVLTPDYGDDIQLMKAGIAEVGDVVVVNKKDKAGAERMAFDAECAMREADPPGPSGWRRPVLLTQALKGEGIEETVRALISHGEHLEREGKRAEKRKEGQRTIMRALLKEALWKSFLAEAGRDGRLEALMADVEGKRIDPYTAADRALREAGGA